MSFPPIRSATGCSPREFEAKFILLTLYQKVNEQTSQFKAYPPQLEMVR